MIWAFLAGVGVGVVLSYVVLIGLAVWMQKEDGFNDWPAT